MVTFSKTRTHYNRKGVSQTYTLHKANLTKDQAMSEAALQRQNYISRAAKTEFFTLPGGKRVYAVYIRSTSRRKK